MNTGGAKLIEHENPSIEQAVNAIHEADLMIGMRLHASIVATSLGIPTVAIGYMPKVRDYMEEIGEGDLCVEVDEVTTTRLIGLVEGVLEEYERVSLRLVKSSRRSAVRFTRNREVLESLLY